jgi:predicted MFS family arabinose efflux permease
VSRWTILAVLSLIRLSFGYQFQSMAALAPAVSRDLGIDQAAAGTLIGLYWASGVLVALPGGWLGQRFGDKPMVLAGGAATVLGGLLCALGESYAALAAGRVIAGLGGIVMNIMAVKMATDWFAGREIGFAFGCLFGSFPLGIALGLALQAPLAEEIGWPAVMLTTAALGALVVAAVALVYRAPARAAAAAPAQPARGFLGGAQIALISAAGIGLALYNGSFLVYVSYAPVLLVSSGFGVVQAGLVLAAASALSTLFLPLGGHLADRLRSPRAVLFAGVAGFVICVALLPAAAASQSLLAVAAIAVAISALGAMPISPMVSLPSEALPAERRALGLGLFYTWFYLGAAASPALGGWLYERTGTPAAPIYLNAALGLVTLALYGVFVFLGRQKRRP